jgi:dTDP-4-amino-4,6-dideoxygalactose transaminase
MALAVPMLDLSRQHRALAAELLPRVQAVLESGQFIGGAEVELLEREFAQRLGVRFTIAMNSGTDALHLALRAAGIGAGDEVITTPFSFVATAAAICHAGARPVFADIDAATFNLDPEAVERALTPRTRALLPVHIFGQPADMPALIALAERHGLVVIEDCAQSFGAAIGGTMTGAFGLAGAFSFYPTKNLGGCGDGGMVVTNSEEFAARVRRLANHGAGAPQQYLELGFNSRLDALQAVALRVKLGHVEAWNAARRRIAARYGELLRGVPLVTPRVAAARTHVFHQYTVLVEGRDEVAAALRRAGIGTAIHYPRPLYRQPALAAYAPAQPLPVVEEVCRRCLSLPIYAELEEREIEAVAAALAHAFG